jgi:hypothetical protein
MRIDNEYFVMVANLFIAKKPDIESKKNKMIER